MRPWLRAHHSCVSPVFTKGSSIHTIPSLSKVLKGITECIIGLQYVWEYRSPSKAVQPHYQCKLCSLSRLQHDMIDHVKSWKHCFRYMKKAHPDRVPCEEEDAIKDPSVKRIVKAAAAEVEKMEGRGQIKVILKEPCDVPAFKGLRSAVPRFGPPPPGMGPMGPPFGPRLQDPWFSGEFPPYGGPSDYTSGEYGGFDFGGYSSRENFANPSMDRGFFSNEADHHPPGSGNGYGPGYGSDGYGPGYGSDGYGPGCGSDGYGRSGVLDDGQGKMYSDGYQGSQMGDSFMNRPMDEHTGKPGLMGAAPVNSNLPTTLLTYLENFKIQNESDAQLVLKVTQKLTDVLMEYRLRSVSEAPSLSSLPMSSTSFSSASRSQSNDDRFSSNLTGPSTYYK
ncbi:unnamed protein product [Menidia menidia]|uniref:(Atlantic silverside) hypothetical protein n=1 Tax=Menidia menidia TaxID=238744 RepID=A0A8S4BNJ3_9TELE|nr:unnamed protein product [Menidia menidia]